MIIIKCEGYKKNWIINKLKEEKFSNFSFFNYIFLFESKNNLDLIINDKYLKKNDYNKCFLIKEKFNLIIADEKMIYDEEIIKAIKDIENDKIYKVLVEKQSSNSNLINCKIIRISNNDLIEKITLNLIEKNEVIEYFEIFKDKEIKMSKNFQDIIIRDLKERFLIKFSINIQDFNYYLFIKNNEDNYDIELTNIYNKRLLVKNVNINFYNSNINFVGINDYLSI